MQMGEDDISREIRMKREKSVREAHERALVEPYKREIARLETVIRGLRKELSNVNWILNPDRMGG